MGSDVSDASSSVTGLLGWLIANYTWYLRDGFPGLIAVWVVAVLNGGLTRHALTTADTPRLIVEGTLLIFLAPAVGILFGQWAFVAQRLENRFLVLPPTFFLGGHEEERTLGKMKASTRPRATSLEDADPVEWAASWLRSNASVASGEADRLRSTVSLMRSLELVVILGWFDAQVVSKVSFAALLVPASAGQAPAWARLPWSLLFALAVLICLVLLATNARVYSEDRTKVLFWANVTQPEAKPSPPAAAAT